MLTINDYNNFWIIFYLYNMIERLNYINRILFKSYYNYFYNPIIILLTPYNFRDKIFIFVKKKKEYWCWYLIAPLISIAQFYHKKKRNYGYVDGGLSSPTMIEKIIIFYFNKNLAHMNALNFWIIGHFFSIYLSYKFCYNAWTRNFFLTSITLCLQF